MYCTIRKRTNKDKSVVYDVSLCQTVRIDGKVKRTAIHVATLRAFAVTDYVNDKEWWAKSRYESGVIKAVRKFYPYLCKQEKRLEDREMIKKAMQIVDTKLKEVSQRLQEEKEEDRLKKEKKWEEFKSKWTEFESNFGSFSSIPVSSPSNENHQKFTKEAYRHLSKKYHPDTGGDEETFKRLKEWYDYLLTKI